jgi:hypothetical protein
MNRLKSITREKWTGHRVPGAADDMAWQRHVKAVHVRLARFSFPRTSVTASATAWDRHVVDVKARVREAKRRG